MANKLRSSKFSILIEESTDKAAVKTMPIVVQFHDKDLRSVCSNILELVKERSPQNPETTAQNSIQQSIPLLRQKCAHREYYITLSVLDCFVVYPE